MKHFQFLSEVEKSTIFYKNPQNLSKQLDKQTLAYALGATLYIPANRKNIAADLIAKKHDGLSSIVICLEDAIDDYLVNDAERSLLVELDLLKHALCSGLILSDELPYIFIRVRNPKHLMTISQKLEERITILTGFVFPKFTYEKGIHYFEGLDTINKNQGLKLYGMPILESPQIIYKETRLDELLKIKTLLDQYFELVLNVRIGATDFSGLFGLRRSSDTTIYDLSVIKDCIGDIINIFTRSEKEYVVSGPVWEYFYNGDRILKPKLRKTPFEQEYGGSGLDIRKDMLNHYIDGLIQEVLLDKANGMIGKTIIHPSHIKPVQALYVVDYEEYLDAKDIISNYEKSNGVRSSEFSNKMNEIKPHYHWAKRILLKSNIYGVYHEYQNFISILSEQVSV